jgi:hypothetical protein
LNATYKSLSAASEPGTRFYFAILLAIVLAPSIASADGGVVRFIGGQGAFVLTIFTPAEVLCNVPAEVAVMVQNRETGEVVMDAEVDLRVVAPTGAIMRPNNPLCGPSDNPLSPGLMDSSAQSPYFRATRSKAANRLFYGTSVVLPVAGDWQIQATVRQGGGTACVTCALPVGMPPRRLAGLWPYLALPPLAIALFVMNQSLRGRLRGGKRDAVPTCLNEDGTRSGAGNVNEATPTF